MIGHCNGCFASRSVKGSFGLRIGLSMLTRARNLSPACCVPRFWTTLCNMLEVEYGNKQAEPNRDTVRICLLEGSGHRYTILRVKSCYVQALGL